MSWDVINLAKIAERELLQPSLGGVGLVYPGKRHVFSGPPESAKTLAAYVIALAVVHTGGSVVLIDFEMGPFDARDRLRELGATETDFELLHYVEPETPATKQTMDALLAWKPSLVIVDAAAGAYRSTRARRQQARKRRGVYAALDRAVSALRRSHDRDRPHAQEPRGPRQGRDW